MFVEVKDDNISCLNLRTILSPILVFVVVALSDTFPFSFIHIILIGVEPDTLQLNCTVFHSSSSTSLGCAIMTGGSVNMIEL